MPNKSVINTSIIILAQFFPKNKKIEHIINGRAIIMIKGPKIKPKPASGVLEIKPTDSMDIPEKNKTIEATNTTIEDSLTPRGICFFILFDAIL